eukprot:2277693-Prymnesium_polylepis.1
MEWLDRERDGEYDEGAGEAEGYDAEPLPEAIIDAVRELADEHRALTIAVRQLEARMEARMVALERRVG